MPKLVFPDGFVWGVAASSYQIEGAWNEDGRGESIWDRFTHSPHHILSGENGDRAVDHYHRMPEDVSLMRRLGIPAYSFTVSWSRVVPDGIGPPNTKGLEFYDRLVDELLKAGVQPMTILNHWDMPQRLQDQGDGPIARSQTGSSSMPTWCSGDLPIG
jgi:beta-glucosidase